MLTINQAAWLSGVHQWQRTIKLLNSFCIRVCEHAWLFYLHLCSAVLLYIAEHGHGDQAGILLGLALLYVKMIMISEAGVVRGCT